MKYQFWLATCAVLLSSVSHAGSNIQVESYGTSIEDAKRNGFREAIEQSVGQLIVSDTEVSGTKVTKDSIGAYSAGYIDDYEILESRQEGEKYVVKMAVSVSSSKIAQRKVTRAQDSSNLNGSVLEAQMMSQLEERYNGDQLLSTVLSSYPENAYVVNGGASELKINRLRKPYLEVDYSITMSRFWTAALVESLNNVAVNSKSCNSFLKSAVKGVSNSNHNSAYVKTAAQNICGREPDMQVSYKNKDAWMAQSDSFYFSDLTVLQLVNSHLQQTQGSDHLGLVVELVDAAGNNLDSGCFKIPSNYFVGYEAPRGTYNLNSKKYLKRPVVQAQQRVAGKLQIGIDPNIPLDEVARLRMTVKKSCT